MFAMLRTVRKNLKRKKYRNQFSVQAVANHNCAKFTHVSGTYAFLPYKDFEQSDHRQLYIVSHGFDAFLAEKYQCPGFEIESSDIVIDCGAFVGGFAVAAAKRAKRVIAVEPSSRNRVCLEKNLESTGLENVTILPKALGRVAGQAVLNLSLSGCDDSMLQPDEGATGDTETVDMITLAQLIESDIREEQSIFLKVEAEGFEIEVLEGLGAFRPRIVTVDVTAERDGKSPRDEIQQILEKKGYCEFHHSARCLFAKM